MSAMSEENEVYDISPEVDTMPFTVEGDDGESGWHSTEESQLDHHISFTHPSPTSTNKHSPPSARRKTQRSAPSVAPSRGTTLVGVPRMVFVRPKSPPGTPRFVPIPGTTIEKRIMERHFSRQRKGDVRSKFDYDNASGCELVNAAQRTERIVTRSNFAHICASVSIDTLMLQEIAAREHLARIDERERNKKDKTTKPLGGTTKGARRLRGNLGEKGVTLGGDQRVDADARCFTRAAIRRRVKKPDALEGRTGLRVSSAGAGCYSIPYEVVADLYVQDGRRTSMLRNVESFVLRDRMGGDSEDPTDDLDEEADMDAEVTRLASRVSGTR